MVAFTVGVLLAVVAGVFGLKLIELPGKGTKERFDRARKALIGVSLILLGQAFAIFSFGQISAGLSGFDTFLDKAVIPVAVPAAIPGVPGAPVAPIVGCQVEDTTLYMNPQDTFARGTDVDVQTSIWVNGEFTSDENDQGDVAVSPGDDIVMLSWLNGEGTTAPKVAGASLGATNPYYGAKKQFTMGCSGTYQANQYVYKYDFNTTNTTYGMQDLSVTVFNPDDQVVAEIAETNAVAHGATSIYEYQIKLKATSETYFSNPESTRGIMMCFDAGSDLANYDEIKVTSHGSVSASVPKALLGTADWCWELRDVTHLKNGETIYVDVLVDTGASDPGATDIFFWIMDTEYYKHTDTAELMGPAYEDNDGNQIGAYVCTTLADYECNNEIAVA